ncbi:low molecular weight phosphatase family protein [Phenylobacterium sp.]|uniref:arsenate-mycothiol transferase ArsC n=1 Tax=Phenylobacterium sp. TaxID=1871053 RepID=UPI0025EC6D7E|nr:low molecular weight phosphatase family protein [Phenylobacterium sp.]MBX3484768.1 low molecular weight phosphatase family protein [Phenylobacterium sp.]MCW5761583.1 low molecular weight phosphatase family protein [Phenylobacterium sp.]
MSDDPGARLPDAVLFCCNYNQVRSPMAESLLKHIVGTRIFVDSCGLRRAKFDPDEDDMEVDPLAAAVMQELGVDLTRHRCKIFDDLEDDSFDLVISLTPEAQHRAIEIARGRDAEIEYWPTMDPTLVEGSREHRLESYRQVRDGLAQRIRARFNR